jgi:type IV secretory pathway TrbD component
MVSEPRRYPVYRSLNKTLTILGVERRLFFLTLVIGAAAFNFFGSLSIGLFMFSLLYAGARWAAARDTEILRIVLNSARFRSEYDPGKFELLSVVRIHRGKPETHR